MSYDLAVWEGPRPANDADALATYQRLLDHWHSQKVTDKTPTARITRYIDALLVRWPDITTDEGVDTSPWSDGPLIGNATGPLFYFGLVFSMAEEASAFAADVARRHGLVCFDPQSGTLHG